jgi:hypothetical protein
VAIEANTSITASGSGLFIVGIADGMVLPDGTVAAGASHNLSISSNRTISSSTFLNVGGTPCTPGPFIAVGLLLAGTTSATVSGNGRDVSADLAGFAGIIGGASNIYPSSPSGGLPNQSAAIWTVDTADAVITDNELRSGTLTSSSLCAEPFVVPYSAGWRDGIVVGAAHASVNALFARNGVLCAQMSPNGGATPGGFTYMCAAVDLNTPPALAGPLVVNNVLASIGGFTHEGLRMTYGAGVLAYNNTIILDWVPQNSDPRLPDTVIKRGIALESIEEDGIALVNNIIYIHADDDVDQLDERLCIREHVRVASAGSHIGVFENNLLFIEDDDLLTRGPVYVRVRDSATNVDYAAGELNDLATVPEIADNFAAPPALAEPSVPGDRTQTRLTSTSPALDAGQTGRPELPEDDIDGDPRPSTGSMDAGSDQLVR